MADIVDLQAPPSSPLPVGVSAATDLLLVPRRTIDRLAHFPEEVYDLSPESHLTRFIKTLLGDAGAGQLRKRMFIARLQQTLHGSHFYDLDRFYGALFNLRRRPEEVLPVDPYSDTATVDGWSDIRGLDASYRSRIIQFARALTYGATPTGIELVAEAVLSVDCEVFESWIQADSSYRTYAELQAAYATYAAMEGISYGVLEGEGLPRLSGNDRRQFTVRPKRQITLSEAYDLTRVLSAIKPADARVIIDFEGVVVHDPMQIAGIFADSDYWEIIPKVSARPDATTAPYQITGQGATEQPRPPFTGYQGEAWSYNGDIIAVSAYQDNADGSGYLSVPSQRVMFPDGTYLDYVANQAVMIHRYVLAGRVSSDGVLVAHPYSGPRRSIPDTFVNSRGQAYATGGFTQSTVAPLYADRIPLGALDRAFQSEPGLERSQQNPIDRYWVTPSRSNEDPTVEVLEVRLTSERLVNYITFKVAHFPNTVTAQVFNSQSGEWVTVYTNVVTDSVPKYLPTGPPKKNVGHPQHSYVGHWVESNVRIDAIPVSRFRLLLARTPGDSPKVPARRYSGNSVFPAQDLSYSLAVRDLDLGYRVSSRDDIPATTTGVIGTTTDVLDTLVQFTVHEEAGSDLLGGGIWRSEPQPVGYAVVNLYTDVRDDTGDSQVIDRFFLDPLYTGAHISLYYSNDILDSGPTSDADFEDMAWTPIPLDFVLQKGFIHIDPTRARYWKFEFTNLVPEPYETFVPITRSVRFFPLDVTLASQGGQGGVPDSAMPAGMGSAITIGSQTFYSDAVRAQRAVADPSTQYTATAALYVQDPLASDRMRDNSWVFGFIPWHQGDAAPRFVQTGPHRYDKTEIVHTYHVGFFVGLKQLLAYRVDYSADDDTEVYIEHFDDFRNIQPGMTWTFDPNQLASGLSVNAVAVSKPMPSRSNVYAIQFATHQTEPMQLIPDDDFVDPALANYDWSDQAGGWSVVGDAQLIYVPGENAVQMIRYETPPMVGLPIGGGIVQSPMQPVFAARPLTYADESAAAMTEGGIMSQQVAPSPVRVYAAARVKVVTDLTSPLKLQIMDSTGTTVLAESDQDGQAGETLEWYLSYDPGTDAVLRVRLVQSGKSNDSWKLDALSLFDESILWEFSVNGGTTFIPATGVRNNLNGVVTFPEEGNELVWRATGYRQNVGISSLKIRPWYHGRNARLDGTHHGPNVSTFDHTPPIQDDPEFTTWTKPVPRSWFLVARRYPILPPEDRPQITKFARFYGRPVTDTVTTVTDSAHVTSFHFRSNVEFPPATVDSSTRTGTFNRTPSDSAPATDGASFVILPAYGGTVDRPVHPVDPLMG